MSAISRYFTLLTSIVNILGFVFNDQRHIIFFTMMSISHRSIAVQASNHQGSPMFVAPGRQCMYNAIASCIMDDTVPVQNWDTGILDRVLKNGDCLCTHSCLRDDFPLITDLNKHFWIDGVEFKVTVGDSKYGSISNIETPFQSITQSLKEASKYSILTIGSCTPAYSCAVIRMDSEFYFFDSHSRDELGMPTSDGKATLTKHSLYEMGQFITLLSASLVTHSQFELTPITITRGSTFVSKHPVTSLPPLSSTFTSSDSDSDTDNIPLGLIKDLRRQVNIQRNRNSRNNEQTGYIIDSRNKESKGKTMAQMHQLLSTNTCPSPCQYDNVSDSDGDTCESYLPPVSKRAKSNEDLPDPSTKDIDDSNLPLNDADTSGTSCNSNENNDFSADSSFDDNISVSQVQSSANVSPSVDIHITRGRRRQRDPDNWVFNIAKKKRNSGEEYVTRKGKVVRARVMRKGCGEKCRLSCHSKINEDQRQTIFHRFWEMGCLLRQRDFISKHVDDVKRKRIRNQAVSRRCRTFKWHFEIDSVMLQVCKTFFLETLDISDTVVFTAMAKTTSEGIVMPEGRGKHSTRPNEKSAEKDVVRAHIERFPKTESHYCRKETVRNYLDGELSLNKMYRMYKEERTVENKTPISESSYKKIFYSEYNLGFFRRSKDRCDFCVAYNNGNDIEGNSEQKAEFERHHKMKQQVRELKDVDKLRAKKEINFSAATFDLEDVLVTPKGTAKGFYYKRRLNTYNLSIFDYGSDLGINNIWNERIGKRGSNEIGSCVYKFVKSEVQKGKTTFSFFSDACGGQNRNKHMVALFWWIRAVHDLEEVKHTFFVSGHSQNEVDGIHSRIEQSCRFINIYTTPQWAACIRTARQKPPRFEVHELDLSDIKNVKSVSEQLKNLDTDTNKLKVQYLKLKRIRVTQEQPNVIYMSYDYDNDTWFQLDLEKRGRKRLSIPEAKAIELKPVRNAHIQLDENKLKDLDSLCEKNLIPQVHHAFFESLH